MKLFKNKNGFLLAEETIKIIIALICIVFLVYFLISIYLKNQENKDLELAKASLEYLIKEVNSGATEVEIYNPSSSVGRTWWILSWPYEGQIPNSCLNIGWKNCICICKKSIFTSTPLGYLEDCDNNGICLESDLIVNTMIKLENLPITLKINSEAKTINLK